jgi:hypothetical protein
MLPVRHLFAFAAGAVLCTAAACGDSTAPDALLSPEEATELARQMEIHFTGGFSSSAAPDGVDVQFNAVPEPFNVSVDITSTANYSSRTSTLTGTLCGSSIQLSAPMAAT